ncbi:MAG: hypothetical protein ACRCZJ_03475 [Erysipelotrichaceae bacterium]
MEISIRLGYFANNTFKINGEVVELDESLVSYAAPQTIRFIIKGE